MHEKVGLNYQCSQYVLYQELLATLPFSHIIHWASGPNLFNLTVGDSSSYSKLMFETSLAYKMDDLLTSYIAHVLANSDKPGKSKPSSSTGQGFGQLI